MELKEQVKEKIKKTMNYDLVKKCISTFSNDIDYISEIALLYIDNSEDEVSKTELLALMNNLINDGDNEFADLLETHYLSDRVYIEIAKKKNLVDGLGFKMMLEKYNYNHVIMNYYAKKFIKDMLVDNNIDLSKLVKANLKGKSYCDKESIDGFLVRLIGRYDKDLSNYVKVKHSLLDDLRDGISKLLKEDKVIDYKTLCMIEEKVHEYYEDNCADSILTETDILYYVGKKLGILEKLYEYDGLSTDVFQIDDSFVEECISLDMFEEANIVRVTKLVRKLLNK